MNSFIKCSLFILFLSVFSSNSPAFNYYTPSLKNPPTALEITAWSLGIIGTYHCINYCTHIVHSYIEDTILDMTADSIILTFTPKGLLHRVIPSDKIITALQKKARYIILRKEVLKKLNDIINTPQKLSERHTQALEELLKKLENSFALIDIFRFKTNYEHSYQLTWIDHYIIGYIVNSLVFATKPENECSPNELGAKRAALEQRKKLIKKLCDKGIDTISLAITNSPLKDFMNDKTWL